MTQPLGPSYPYRCSGCGHEVEGGNLDGHPCVLCNRGLFAWLVPTCYRRIAWDDPRMHQRVYREWTHCGKALPPNPLPDNHARKEPK